MTERKPRPVTREDIAAFERACPQDAGIAPYMVKHGIWRIVEDEECQKVEA